MYIDVSCSEKLVGLMNCMIVKRLVLGYSIGSGRYIQPPDVCCSASNIQLSSSREATTRLSFAWTAA